MKFCLAQIRPVKNQIDKNIQAHLACIKVALKQGADLVVFSELSISGYLLESAESLAIDLMDQRFDVFQDVSNQENVTLLIGAPLKSGDEIQIGMILFQPNQSRKSYSKQLLHADEEPYFACGKEQLLVTVQGKTIAPAICYEALQTEHLEKAIQLGADIYLASVAKPKKGINRAKIYFPETSKKHSIPILLINAIGEAEDFMCDGQSSVWNNEGVLLAELSESREELLFYSTEGEKMERVELKH